MKRAARLLACGVLLAAAAASLRASGGEEVHESGPAGSGWEKLEPGLALGSFDAGVRSSAGDSRVHVLRIDPARFSFVLLNASAKKGGAPHSAKQWAVREHLVAAINASMYQADGSTSVSLMRTRGHTNNAHLTADKDLLAFDPVGGSEPPVRIIDRECDDLGAWEGKYGTLVQSIRMISCKGQNVWKQQPRKWSTAAIGTDAEGRVLFVHVRSPYTTHDLIEILKRLPLGLDRAMYAEGGPEAQLYVDSEGKQLEFVGSFETSFNENDDLHAAWPVPNVVGIVRKPSNP